MYNKKTTPVPVPNPDYGTIFIDKRGYVLYITDSHWDPDLHRMVDARTSIGKVLPDDKSLMYPGPKFFLFQDELIITSSAKSPTEARNFNRIGNRISYGDFALLRQAADKIGCLDALKSAFPGTYREIEAIALFGVESCDLTAEKYEYWADDHYLGLDKNMSDTTIGRIYDELADDRSGMIKFQMLFKDAFRERVPEGRARVVAFDSTNQNTASKSSELAAYGHPKKNKKLPIINTSVFVDEKSGIPIYMENYIGSITDKTQTPVTMGRAHSLGYEHLLFMMDRGYWSSKALKAIEAEDYEFGIMVPDNISIDSIMYEAYGSVLKNKQEYWIDREKIYGLKVRRKVDGLSQDKEYSVYLYYDDVRASQERQSINKKIAFFEGEIKSRIKFSEKLKKTYEDWFDISRTKEKDPETGKYFTWKRKNDVIQNEIDQAGFFCIVSDADLTAEEMIIIARHRDTAEKIFSRLKSGLGTETSHVQDKHYEPKMFVSFIAEIIEKAFCYYAQDYLHKSSSGNSADLPILEMKGYKIEYGSTNEWYPVGAATKVQKQILKTVGLTEQDLIKEVHKLI